MTRTASSLGGPGGQLARAREELRRPVLHRAEQASVVVVVDRPPGAPLVLGVADPLALVGAAPVPRLPPDALVADGRRRLDRRSGQPGDPRRHAIRPHGVDDDLDGRRLDVGHAAEVLAHALLDAPADRRDRRPPLRDEVQLDAHGAVLARHAHGMLPRQRTVREPSHSVDFPRRVRGVAGEDLGRDRRLTGHSGQVSPVSASSSVASGRAAKRNGTNVVPSPAETCIVAAALR